MRFNSAFKGLRTYKFYLHHSIYFSTSGSSLVQRSPTKCVVSECDREISLMRRPWLTRSCCALQNTGCPTTYQTWHFFNNSKTNEDIATRFEQEYVRCVRNEEKCVCSVCLFRCNIVIGVRIIKEMPGSVASGTPYIMQCNIISYSHVKLTSPISRSPTRSQTPIHETFNLRDT